MRSGEAWGGGLAAPPASRRPTRRTPSRLLAAALLLPALGILVPATLGGADDETLLIEFPRGSDALPNAVTPSGHVVVGKFADSGGFYWMPTTGVIDLGGAFASGVSADGETVVGGSPPAPGILNAGVWLRAMEWRLFGSFPGAEPCSRQLSQANGVSRDGRVVVGSAYDGCGTFHAVRWEEGTGIVDLGSLFEGRPSRADGVSGDGRVVVGYQETPEGQRRGARWVDGREELFEGPAGPVGIAGAANVDGSIVAGAKCMLDVFEDQSAWVWTAAGGVECLPVPALRTPEDPLFPPNFVTRASAVSEDGRIIAGGQTANSFTEDSHALVWINRTPVYLKDLLRANGVPDAFEGWFKTGEVTDMTPDGRVLVGWGASIGGFRGYIVILGSNLVMP